MVNKILIILACAHMSTRFNYMNMESASKSAANKPYAVPSIGRLARSFMGKTFSLEIYKMLFLIVRHHNASLLWMTPKRRQPLLQSALNNADYMFFNELAIFDSPVT